MPWHVICMFAYTQVTKEWTQENLGSHYSSQYLILGIKKIENWLKYF